MKTCTKCNKLKKISEFYRCLNRKSGITASCKVCQKKITSFRKYGLKRYHIKYGKDINYTLKAKLRCRLNRALKNHQKRGSAVKDLGCSIDQLKQHLEAQFQSGMTWENHGKWHIDHIIPLSKFNLSEKEEFLKAVHYTNLQPLWALDNLKKSNK